MLELNLDLEDNSSPLSNNDLEIDLNLGKMMEKLDVNDDNEPIAIGKLLLPMSTLDTIIKKFAFIEKGGVSLQEQLVYFFSKGATTYVFAQNPRFTHATIVPSVESSSTCNLFFNMPFKYLKNIYQSSKHIKGNTVLFDVDYQETSVQTKVTKWSFRQFTNGIDVDTILSYYTIDSYSDEVLAQKMHKVIATLLPYIEKDNPAYMYMLFDGNFAYCKTALSYTYTTFMCQNSYILSYDVARSLKTTLTGCVSNDILRIWDNEDDIYLFRYKDDILVARKTRGSIKASKMLQNTKFNLFIGVFRDELRNALKTFASTDTNELYMKSIENKLILTAKSQISRVDTAVTIQQPTKFDLELVKTNLDTFINIVQKSKSKTMLIATLQNSSEHLALIDENDLITLLLVRS